MAIPVYLQQFKAAGIYRIVFDKSTVAGVDSNVLRLVVGYSEKGPFNIPTYITSVSDFKAVYGDISKKLEKRGVFFHRMAIEALAAGPILALNLKKFSGETVDGATINTDFNPQYDIINTVKLNVEDIYDTTRFWELSAEKLNGMQSVSGAFMDQYINICAVNTKEMSGSYFIRKASGNKVNGYNITISDWYSDKHEELPDYLEPYKNSLVSDFFAEIYVFKGRFTKSQVLASSTLKYYFDGVEDSASEDVQLKPFVLNAYGDEVDTLDELYKDETSSAIGHYVGSLIPYFKNKQGQYVSLDILFNSDLDVHNMMMSFNVDLLEEEGTASIDLSGRLSIRESFLKDIFKGEATTSLLGNKGSKVVTDIIDFTNNVVKTVKDEESGESTVMAIIPFDNTNERRVTGTLYVSSVVMPAQEGDSYQIILTQVGEPDNSITISCGDNETEFWKILGKLKAKAEGKNEVLGNGYGSVFTSGNAFIDEDGKFTNEGPEVVITAITRLEVTSGVVSPYSAYTDSDFNMKVSTMNVTFTSANETPQSVYGSSLSFIPMDASVWVKGPSTGTYSLENTQAPWDRGLFTTLSVGDCFLATDGTVDRDNDGEADNEDGFLDNVYVQNVAKEAIIGDDGEPTGDYKYVITFSKEPLTYVDEETGIEYLVRIDHALNQEVGTMVPQYLEGYVYKNPKPESTSMMHKLEWQNFILSTISEYKGLKTALLNKANVDFRYVVDTFESYVDESVKKVLSFLSREKGNSLSILNFPSVKTFLKCPYTSFTDAKGVFNVNYVAEGYNKKKAFTKKFSLPTENEGASFAAFYTPVKLSDGYVDTIVPSAALVSNLFMTKYTSRQPYYIVAGPNYAKIETAGLVGPDYTYSMDELQVIEPFGVNCLVYRPGFGTFVNANQTAKQTPVSALSKVNVRELVIFLQDEIEKVLQAYQWEFNNPTTRNAILDRANFICARVAANGGIQAYLNVMDESNNTPEIIDNEMAILSTHIEPGMGCGKMIHELTLYRTGQMSSNIIETK